MRRWSHCCFPDTFRCNVAGNKGLLSGIRTISLSTLSRSRVCVYIHWRVRYGIFFSRLLPSEFHFDGTALNKQRGLVTSGLMNVIYTRCIGIINRRIKKGLSYFVVRLLIAIGGAYNIRCGAKNRKRLLYTYTPNINYKPRSRKRIYSNKCSYMYMRARAHEHYFPINQYLQRRGRISRADQKLTALLILEPPGRARIIIYAVERNFVIRV